MTFLEGIAVGDLHLDKFNQSGWFDDPNALQVAHLDTACTYAMKSGIHHVFLLGDVCDRSRLSYEAQLALLACFCKWDGILSIYVILGNHDFDETGIHSLQVLSAMHGFKMFKTIHIYAKAHQATIDGIHCNFLSYPTSTPIPAKLPTLNFGHFEVRGSLRDNGGTIRKGVEPDDANEYILGHLHTPHAGRNWHYTGTLYQLNFGESLPKSFTHFRAKYKGSKLVLKTKRIPSEPSFILENRIVTSRDDLTFERNPNHLYKLFVEQDVVLPDDLLLKHPNIVKTVGYTTKSDLEALMHETFDFEHHNEELDFDAMMTAYLANKGANAQNIERAFNILKDLGLWAQPQ